MVVKHKWLILILVAGLLLRTIRLDYVELFGDELDAGYQAYSLLTTGRDYKGHWWPTYMQSFSEWRAPGLMYAMVPFIKIWGLNEWGVRLTTAFFGMMSIWLFYLVLGEIKVEEKTKLMTTGLLAITPWQIQYSRAGFELTLLATLIFGGCWLLIKRKVILAGVIFGLSFYTYSTANVLVPMIILLTLFIGKARRKQIGLLAIVGGIMVLPIAYQIGWGHAADRFGTLSIANNKEVVAEIEAYRNAANNSRLSKVFYNKITLAAKRMAFNYGNAFGVDFLFRNGDVTFRHSLQRVGNLFWIELPLIVWGLIKLINKKEPLRIWVIGLLLISPIAAAVTIDGFNHASRLFLMVYPLSLLAAYGLGQMGQWWQYGAIVILLFELANFQFYYWTYYRNESWKWWHTGYKEAMQYIGKNQGNYQRVVMDNTYEPALIRFLFWNKVDPRKVFGLADNRNQDIEGAKGFNLEDKYWFVNFGDKFEPKNMKNGWLYLISQEKNVGGDWDWSKNPPAEVKVEKTVRNYQKEPIFYLVSKL